MGFKKKHKKEEVPETVNTLLGVPQELGVGEVIMQAPCSSWCFLLGAGFQASCHRPLGHEGEHEILIELVTEPKSRFTIHWELL